MALSSANPKVLTPSPVKSPAKRVAGDLLLGNTLTETDASGPSIISGTSSLLQATMPKAIIATNNNLNSFILFKI